MNPNAILAHSGHRPWPLPAAPWVMQMGWRDLALFHWRVSPERLRPHIPPPLEIDTYNGAAWIGVVPFWMDEVRLRAMPPIPTAHRFPELNVRTYVRSRDRSGVWFFSLDATSRLAVRGGRLLNLPYFDASIEVDRREKTIHYKSRSSRPAALPAEFDASYAPVDDVWPADSGSLDHWLSERYCLFTRTPGGKISFIDVHHFPWPLQKAEAEIRANTLTRALGINIPDAKPLVHYAGRLDVLAWAPAGVRA